MNPEIQMWALRLAGMACLGLVAANIVLGSRLDYARNLEKSDQIVRQIFYVHCGYIVFLIMALGVLCLGWPGLLLEKGMGQVVSGFFAVFWTSRVVIQVTYYDAQLRREERFWDVFFLLVFAGLALIFTFAAL